ncbi:MAG: NAD-dependent epimerase/dehydratase family protein [Myxococcota bacterium]
MRVLVAGASGFIGAAVVRTLLGDGHDVVAVSRTRGSLPTGVEHVAADLTRAAPDPGDLGSVDAVVNLVGIAIERGGNTFEAAHVDAVRHLLALSSALQVARFVHVSVVRIDASDGAYHRTKRAGEALVKASALPWSIVRPGLVYGPGDAMLSNLVRFIRLAPVFPVPAGEGGPLQVVDVDDVADAAVRCLHHDAALGAAIDVVGPARFTLPRLIETVSGALGHATLALPLPRGLMRMAAATMQRILPNPPVTPTQLAMLIEGLYGDANEAAARLDLRPRPIDASRIRALAADVEGPSLRLVPSADARDEASAWSVPPAFIVVAVALLLLAGALPSVDIWRRMLGINAVLVAGLTASSPPLRRWLRPSPGRVAWGLGAAAVMVGGAVITIAALRATVPEMVEAASSVYAWGTTHHPLLTLPLLVLVAGLEDLVWRFGVTLGLVRRLGPLPAVLAGGLLFALAHATVGPPILVLAAALAGVAWSALAVRTRSWVAVMTCHVLWDAAMVMLAP